LTENFASANAFLRQIFAIAFLLFCWIFPNRRISQTFKKRHIFKNFSQQKILHILLVSTFSYCELGHGVVGSRGLLKILRQLSQVGSAIFLPKSIITMGKKKLKSRAKNGQKKNLLMGEPRGHVSSETIDKLDEACTNADD